MTRIHPKTLGRRATGFSLIEAMIALLVLSIGLLALAVLQVTVMRNSGETKARTSALSLAQEKLEELKSFSSLDGYKAIQVGASGSTLSDMTTAAQTGTTFTRSWTVRRYVYDRSTRAFADVGASRVTATDVQLLAFNANLQPGTEFKRVDVTVGWQDAASGASTSITVGDIIDAIDPGDTAAVIQQITSAGKNPLVRIYDPALQEGVVPIAVGNNQSSASSDPKPVQEGSDGNVTTRYTVASYVKDGNDARILRLIDTVVTSCQCTSVQQNNTYGENEGPFAPSYWDGDKFTTPEELPNKPRGWINDRVGQNERLCSVCCRDHHDVSTQTVKFDPFRPSSDFTGGDHNHYRNTNRGGTPAFQLLGDGGNKLYDEACRFVRVDGIYRATTDPRMENVAMLNMERATNGDTSLSSSTTTAYSSFAQKYLESLANSAKGGADQANYPDFTSSSGSLGQLDPVTLRVGGIANLHSRAIFADWVSPETIKKLNCVGTDSTNTECSMVYPSYQTMSALQIMPFVAINLTNIGEWAENSARQIITMRNEAIPNDASTSFVRGEVTAVKSGNAVGTANSYRGADALTDQYPIDPNDAGYGVTTRPEPFSVARNVQVTGGVTQNARFVLEVIDSTADSGNFPSGGINVTSCTRGAGKVGTDPTDGSKLETNEHLCAVDSQATTMTLILSNYNRVTNIVCPTGSKGNNYSYVANSYPPVCEGSKNHDIVAATSYVNRDYKLCNVASPVSGATFTSPVETNPSTSTPKDPTKEVTTIVLTMTPDASVFDLKRALTTFVKQTGTCP
ncbi:type IV pilus modification PilV family protein [Tahibacter amnicola]|uniref:Prepilin-type N-terminal cleavage/methylation domain-containing protein n=1 Tax=Tahibacter amnicola TaxID=2976241 RepID=A0ABY6BIU2_9GAMM|nr:prepilin-type N-terminal cleavage/methylation domain-containing protein [Tahibacter amnicola]UXI69684.1 prepilin-type N-terminal cleavage/methylation domain-containing protein [Tahibacter amnicola]